MDIGTGTGVIALMIAQRNELALIDALDIDAAANQTAAENFKNSKFHNRIKAHNQSFQDYFELNGNCFYDLMVSNPPYFLNALKSKEEKKNLARHTNEAFFTELMTGAYQHLTPTGKLQIIVPTQIEQLIVEIANTNHLQLHSKINISSFENSKPIRCILSLGKNPLPFKEHFFHIYAEQGIHSKDYQTALKDFFTIF